MIACGRPNALLFRLKRHLLFKTMAAAKDSDEVCLP